MHSEMLFRFLKETSYQEIPRAWQSLKSQRMLALVYRSDSKQMMPYSSTLTFVLFDMNTLTTRASVSWQCSDVMVEMLHLVSVSPVTHWIIASLELKNDVPSYHLIVRSFVFDGAYQNISVDVLLDIPAEDMAPIGPIYATVVKQGSYAIIYRKPTSDFMGDSFVYLNQINSSKSKVKPTALAEADSALAYAVNDKVLLLTLNPYKDAGWEFRLSCFNSLLFDRLWQTNFGPYLPEVPTFPLAGNSDLEWLGINATIMPAWLPQNLTQQTWVLGATMVDISFLSGHEHNSAEASSFHERVSMLIWLDINGHELWRCSENVGLRLQLCQVDNLVVGVDFLDKRWRLWMWNQQQGTALQNVVYLDREIFRAHLLGDKGTRSKNFWLLEESKEGIKVSQRTPFLQEALSVVWLP